MIVISLFEEYCMGFKIGEKTQQPPSGRRLGHYSTAECIRRLGHSSEHQLEDHGTVDSNQTMEKISLSNLTK
jgi:hypothetical protein